MSALETAVEPLLQTLESFFATLENPDLTRILNSPEKLTSFFDHCLLISEIFSQSQKLEKSDLLERLLNLRQSPGKRSLSELENPCEKLLETCLKTPGFPSELLGALLSLYIKNFGHDKLETRLREILENSFFVNAIAELLQEIGADSEAEEEIVSYHWERLVCLGQGHLVRENAEKMTREKGAGKVLRIAVLLENSDARKIVLEDLVRRIAENEVELILEILRSERKTLRKVVEIETSFRVGFMDAAFYFCRELEKIEGSWKSRVGVEYEDVLRMFRILMEAGEETAEATIGKVGFMREEHGDRIWSEIGRDCAC